MNQDSTIQPESSKTYGSSISDLLRRLTKLYESVIAKALKEIGLTNPQMMVLKQIIREPKTLGHISQAVQLSNSTVSGILDRLERDDWIERIRDEEDRRIIWIRKTEKISGLRDKFELFRESFYDHLFDDISDAEIEHIVRSLDILITHLECKLEDEASRS
ncbi:MarR family transcriptional regulator [Paenibacillus filicis]|uniref:MarR family transcriptional regulator n=1 Tax=Paenibacillus gyeongsangnamensis TaxID=3388067 RepID=A0ABT4QIQ6_9BACL|nr:MarR family transcriptional regulator [Paenibacillus filicis]MCZ8516761.1 MarR family transcriptional regulator [Paenibacillus filicis]